jgi:hypothetical protein
MIKAISKYKNSHPAKWKTLFLTIAFLACFLLIYLLNRLYPVFGEDWDYSYFWIPTNDHPDRIQSIADIISSQYNHYLYWGGRNIAHGLDQFLLMLGERWHDILNALAFIILCLTIYKIANKKSQVNISVLVAIFLALWFLQPTFFIDVLWLTYSANYLWTTMIIVLFLYPYYSYYRNNKPQNNLLQAILFLPFGIIAGWTNENMGPALILLVTGFILLIKFDNKEHIPYWAITGLIGVIAGYFILFTAPGNYVRLEDSDSGFWSIFSSENLLLRIKSLARGFFHALLFPTILYGILIAIYYKKPESEDKKKIIKTSCLFYIAALVALLVLFFTPNFGRHILFGVTTLAIIASMIIYANLDLKGHIRILNVILLIIISGVFAFDYYKSYVYYDYVDKFWKNRASFVEQQKEKGIKDIIFTDYIETNYNKGMYDLYDCPECWGNRVYARYYGINTVRVQPNNKTDAENTGNIKE